MKPRDPVFHLFETKQKQGVISCLMEAHPVRDRDAWHCWKSSACADAPVADMVSSYNSEMRCSPMPL
jgi:hypothetical protein